MSKVLILKIDIDALIKYWSDYRADCGWSLSLGPDGYEKVLHTIICLDELKLLHEFGIIDIEVNNG